MRKFLTAQWLDLIMANYLVEPNLLCRANFPPEAEYMQMLGLIVAAAKRLLWRKNRADFAVRHLLNQAFEYVIF